MRSVWNCISVYSVYDCLCQNVCVLAQKLCACIIMFSLEILGQSSVYACFLCCPCNTCPCGCAQSRNAFVFCLAYGLYHNWLLVSANVYCAFKCSTNCTCFCVFYKLWNRGFFSVYAPSAFCKPTPIMSVIVVVVFVVVLNFIVACITLHK